MIRKQKYFLEMYLDLESSSNCNSSKTANSIITLHDIPGVLLLFERVKKK